MLTIHNLQKRFNEGSHDEKIALRSIDLTLQDKDFVTIIGSNGAGKSTLLNCISGTLPIEQGDVLLDNQNVEHLPEHKRAKWIGRVFQDPMAGTSPTLTIEENLAIAYSRNTKRSFRFAATKHRREFFKSELEALHLNLENRLTTKVGMLSGGERQALSLLMATFTNPSILLLDEHTAALDPARAELITQLTKQLVDQKGLTTLMVTHNMQQASRISDNTAFFLNGELIEYGETSQIFTNPKEKQTEDYISGRFG